MNHCADCDKEISKRIKRCPECHAKMNARAGSQGVCQNCRQETIICYSDLCKSCYNYQRRTGVPRPPELYVPREQRVATRSNRRSNDNYYGGERYCIQIGCHRPSVKDAPWGMGFCKYCLPKIEKILRRQYRNRKNTRGEANV